MPPDNKDMARLWDMLDAARSIVGFTIGLEFEAFTSDKATRLAAERCIEIIGESAKRVSPQVRTRYPEVPWSSFAEMSNLLAHEFGQVKDEQLWLVCVESMPKLIDWLESMGIELHEQPA